MAERWDIQEEKPSPRRWWVAGLSSVFLPGLGQLYNGDWFKALSFFLGAWIMLFLTGVSVLRHPTWVYIALLAIPLEIVIVTDAVRDAKSQKADYFLKPFNRWYVYVVAVLLCSRLTTFYTESVASNYSMPGRTMESTVLPGDTVLAAKYTDRHLSVPLSWLLPQQHPIESGDVIVALAPASILPPELRVRDVRKTLIKRVVAVGGDEVKIVNKNLYVNGTLQTDAHAVRRDAKVFPSLSAKVPDGFQNLWESGGLTNIADKRVYRDNFGPVRVPKGSYFLLGDNRDYSVDSRLWGPISETQILGRAWSVIWSFDPLHHQVRWNRIGQRIQ